MTDLPLPEPAAGYGAGCNIELTIGQHLYTADQLHAYAAAKTAALQAECARLRAFHDAWDGQVAHIYLVGGDAMLDLYNAAHKAALRGKETP